MLGVYGRFGAAWRDVAGEATASPKSPQKALTLAADVVVVLLLSCYCRTLASHINVEA